MILLFVDTWCDALYRRCFIEKLNWLLFLYQWGWLLGNIALILLNKLLDYETTLSYIWILDIAKQEAMITSWYIYFLIRFIIIS